LSTAQLNIGLEDEGIIVPVEAKLIVSGSVIFVCTKCQPDSESGARNCWERSGLHIIQHEQVSSVSSVSSVVCRLLITTEDTEDTETEGAAFASRNRISR